MTEPRTYAGWKAGLAVVFAVVVTITVVNLLAGTQRGDRDPVPGKVVTTVTPAGSP